MARPAARQLISMRQPWPTRSAPPTTQSSGMKTFSPVVGPFGKDEPEGKWRRPILTPGWLAGISASVMPGSLPLPSRVFRVEQMEGEAQQRGLRRQRDIALVPADADADDLLAVVHALLDIAHVAHAGGVGAGEGAGQREAGDLPALRQRLQILLLLRVRAEFLDQLAGPERVRHHDHDGGVRVARGDLAQDDRLRLARET